MTMPTVQDFENGFRDLQDLYKLTNEDIELITRYGPQPKKSWLKLQGEFEDIVSDLEANGQIRVDNVIVDLQDLGDSRLSSILSGINTNGNNRLDAILVNINSEGDEVITSFKTSSQQSLTSFNVNSVKAIEDFEADAESSIDKMEKSRGFRVVGLFNDGFDYELFNDVGLDSNGDAWIYIGTGAPIKTVAPNTNPSSSSDYLQVTFESITHFSIWGDRYAGAFVSGFTITDKNQVGVYSDNKYYSYVGSNQLPIYVNAQTNPATSSNFKEVSATTHEDQLGASDRDAHSDTSIRKYTTAELASLELDNLEVGDSIVTFGYSAHGDGGGNQFLVVPGGSGTVEGGYINLRNGLQAKAVFNNNVISVEQFGGLSLDSLNAALKYASLTSNQVTVKSAGGTLTVEDTVVVTGSNINVDLSCTIVASDTLLESMVTIHTANNIKFKAKRLIGNVDEVGSAIEGLNGVTVTNSDDVIVYETEAVDTSNHGILFTQIAQGGVTGVALENLGPVKNCYAIRCKTEDNGNGAIIFQSGQHGWALYNTCINPGNEGLQMIDGWSYGVMSGNRVFTTNTPCIAMEQHQDRDLTGPVSNITITENFLQAKNHVIVFEHRGDEFKNIAISNNHIRSLNTSGNEFAAITTSNSQVKIDGLTITGNTIRGTNGQKLTNGVDFYNPNDNRGYVKNALISGNVFSDLKSAVKAAGGDNRDGLIITSNQIENAEDGIWVQDAGYSVIESNKISLCNSSFIRIGSTLDGGPMRGFSVTGNTLHRPNSALTAGIFIEDGTSTIENYTVKDNQIDLVGATNAEGVVDEVKANNAIVYDNMVRTPTGIEWATESGLVASTENFNTITRSGEYVNRTDNTVGAPSNTLFSVRHTEIDEDKATQDAIEVGSASSGSVRYYRERLGGVWQVWNKIYDSGNSVNPLDFGLGIDGSSNTGITISNLDGFDNSSGMFIVASGTSGTKPDGLVGNAVLTHKIFTPDRQAQVWHTCSGSGDVYTRELPTRSRGWTEWKKLYGEGNTNFTTLKGENIGDQLGGIVYRNTNTLFMVKDITGYTSAPSSITCTGTFKITNQSGVDRITGIASSDITLDVLTSSKRLKLRINNVDPTVLAFGGNETYELSAETAGAEIEVNP